MEKEKVIIETSKEGFVDVKNIAVSDIFIVIMSKYWEQDPLRLQELEIAKQHHVPIAALVMDGIDEKKYLADADVLVVKKCAREEASQAIMELHRAIETELAIPKRRDDRMMDKDLR